ncbi:MAG: hypothetical protein CVV27_10465, partial [Candidatus Melainabacteria bacterium HGW-Melainabacteria-1]
YADFKQLRTQLSEAGGQKLAELLTPLHYLVGGSRYSPTGDHSEIKLQGEIARTDFGALIGQATGIPEAQERARISSVKANMHTLQTLVETYAVDWGGIYPRNLQDLYAEASRKTDYGSYWRDVKNPYSAQSGIGHQGSLLDFKNYLPEAKADFKGLAMYQPLPGPEPTSYAIYGTDQHGDLIQDRQGGVFVLSNS